MTHFTAIVFLYKEEMKTCKLFWICDAPAMLIALCSARLIFTRGIFYPFKVIILHDYPLQIDNNSANK